MSIDLIFDKYDAETDRGSTPLLIAHGLLGQRRNFATLAKRFATERDVFVVDMRNHGDSPWDARMDYGAMAEDLAALIARHMGGKAHVFGHSMGGKAAMRLALEFPERAQKLVVGDIAPVAYSHSHDSLIGAMQSLDLAAISSLREADAMLAERVNDRPTRAFLLQNLRRGGDQAPGWKANLEVLSDAMSTLTGWDDVPGAVFDRATFFLAGGASEYVLPAHKSLILDHFSQAKIEHLPGVGHWIHAQAPDAVFEKVTAFLADR